MTTAEHLWWHQSRLVAWAVKYHLKQGMKAKSTSSQRRELERSINSCKLLILLLKEGAPNV